jgi:hypothetical protein
MRRPPRTSGKFQPQLFIKELNTQRALGSYETVEEAAAVLATANDKMKPNKESVFVMVPVRQQARSTARYAAPRLGLPALCPAHRHTSAHAHHADHAAPRVAGVNDGRGA